MGQGQDGTDCVDSLADEEEPVEGCGGEVWEGEGEVGEDDRMEGIGLYIEDRGEMHLRWFICRQAACLSHGVCRREMLSMSIPGSNGEIAKAVRSTPE